MNSENANKFIKESRSYVTNINRTLKNIKSEVMADFIHMENSGLVIMTNKVTSALDLQTIKKYIKNNIIFYEDNAILTSNSLQNHSNQ